MIYFFVFKSQKCDFAKRSLNRYIPSICYNMRYLICASCDPSANFDMVYLKNALKNPIGGLCFIDPFS
jgi:hypothetical protein